MYDIVFHLGNATKTGSKSEMKEFSDWFSKIKATTKIYIPGEKDKLFYKSWPSSYHWLDKSIQIIFNNIIKFNGITFWCHAYIQKDSMFSNHDSIYKSSSNLRKICKNLKDQEIDVVVSTTSGVSQAFFGSIVKQISSVIAPILEERNAKIHVFSKGASSSSPQHSLRTMKISSFTQMTLNLSDLYYIYK